RYQDGAPQAALLLCWHILQNDPGDAATRQLLGTLARQASADRDAPLMDQVAMVYFNLGNALRDQGQVPEAVQCYGQSLLLNSRRAQPYINLGNILQAQGHLEEASRCFEKALDCDSQSATAHFNLANSLAEQGRLTDAAASYRQALAINPLLPS